jgi:Na+/proline symporter
MNPAGDRRFSPWPLWAVALAATTVAAFLGITSARIVHEAGLQEVYPADAIVVFGAAEYAGRPSPVSAPAWITPTICSNAPPLPW